MLIVKINLERSDENLKKVVDALEGLDIIGVSWETSATKPEVKIKSGQSDPADLGAAVSAAADLIRRRQNEQ